jgi:molybdate transport system ATP-binding protein
VTIDARFNLVRPGFRLDVGLTLPARGVIALFGPSGSGKTTLLRCVAGLERAAGELQVDGVVWQNAMTWVPTHLRPIGYVFQEASLFAHLSVLGNLRYGLARSRAAAGNSLDQAIALLGIGALLERQPERLSGGERQRVAIARALAVAPRLLLMDEPLAALDLARKQEILPYLERLHDELAIPILYVSHAADEVARLADHLVVLDTGRALASGPLAQTLARLDLPIRLGEDAATVLDTEVAAIDARWHLARLDFAGGSLWARDAGLPVGRRVRVRILARDVSLALAPPGPSSIQNLLQGRVDAIADDAHPGSALVRVAVGNATLLARVTQRAVAQLSLAAGLELWVQVKSVALLD